MDIDVEIGLEEPTSPDDIAGPIPISYTLSHCLVAHRELRAVPIDPKSIYPDKNQLSGVEEQFRNLGEPYQSIISNELISDHERILWLEKPTFFTYVRSQLIALFCIFLPIVVFGIIFMVGSDSPFALIGALLVWLFIVAMFVLRWFCNVSETPRTCYVLTDSRALVIRCPFRKREVISVTYFEMRSKTGVSNIHFYSHWDKTGSVLLSEVPDFGRVSFTRVKSFEACKEILERETKGLRPKTAPTILKRAFIAQLLKENEKPGDIRGLSPVEIDARRSRRAMAIVREQERRREMGVRGSSSAIAQLRANRSSPLSGALNPVIRRESAMSAFSLGSGESEGGDTPRTIENSMGRGLASPRGRPFAGGGPGGRGRGSGLRPSPLGRGAAPARSSPLAPPPSGNVNNSKLPALQRRPNANAGPPALVNDDGDDDENEPVLSDNEEEGGGDDEEEEEEEEGEATASGEDENDANNNEEDDEAPRRKKSSSSKKSVGAFSDNEE